MTNSPSGRVRSLGAQSIMLAAASAVSQVIVAVLYILSARASSPFEYGQVVTAISVGLAAVGFVDFGTTSLWVREVASRRMTTHAASARVAGKLAIAMAIAIVGVLLALVLAPSLLPAPLIFFAALAAQTLMIPLRAAQRGEMVAGLLLGERLTALAVFLALGTTGLDTTRVLWISLLAGTISLSVLALALTPRSSRFSFARPRGNPWGGARHYGVSSIAASAQQLDLAILGAVGGTAAAGIYGSVNRWTQPMSLLANSLSSAAAPFFARSSSWSDARQAVSRAVWLLLLAISACLVVIVAAPVLVETLLGANYAGAVPALQLLAAGTIAAILNQPIATALQARGHDRAVGWAFLSCVLVQLTLVALLAPTLHAVGAALAFVVLQFLLLGLLIVILRTAVLAERRGRPRPAPESD